MRSATGRIQLCGWTTIVLIFLDLSILLLIVIAITFFSAPFGVVAVRVLNRYRLRDARAIDLLAMNPSLNAVSTLLIVATAVLMALADFFRRRAAIG